MVDIATSHKPRKYQFLSINNIQELYLDIKESDLLRKITLENYQDQENIIQILVFLGIIKGNRKIYLFKIFSFLSRYQSDGSHKLYMSKRETLKQLK